MTKTFGLEHAHGEKLTKMAAVLGTRRLPDETDEALRARAIETFYLANPPAVRSKQLRSAMIAAGLAIAVFAGLLMIGASFGWSMFIAFVALGAGITAANQWDANEAAMETAEHLRAEREKK